MQELWGGARDDEYAETVGPEVNPMRHAAAKEHVAALATKNENEDNITRPYSGKTLPHATLYSNQKMQKMEPWLRAL